MSGDGNGVPTTATGTSDTPAVRDGRLREFARRHLSGRVARGATGLLALRCTFIGLGFAQAVLVARLAGPVGYGAYAFALAITNLAAMFACLGFGQLAVREAARYMAREQWALLWGFVRRSHLIAGLVGIAVAAVLAAIATEGAWIESETRNSLLVFSFFVPVFAMMRLRQGLLHGLGAVVRSQIPDMLVRPVCFVSLLLVVAFMGRKLSGFEVAILVSTAIVAAFVVGSWLLRGELRIAVPRGVAPEFEARYWLVQGTPFMLIAGVGFLNQELGTIMLGAMAGTEETGLYQPVLRLAVVMLLPHIALSAAIAPRIAALYARNETVAMERLLIRGARADFLIGILWTGALVIIGPTILGIFGEEFKEGSDALLFVALGRIVVISMGFSGVILAMSGRQVVGLYTTGLGCSINLALCYYLIPTMGISGAAIAMTIGVTLTSVLNTTWIVSKMNIAFHALQKSN